MKHPDTQLPVLRIAVFDDQILFEFPRKFKITKRKFVAFIGTLLSALGALTGLLIRNSPPLQDLIKRIIGL